MNEYIDMKEWTQKKFIDQIAVHAYIVNGDLDGV